MLEKLFRLPVKVIREIANAPKKVMKEILPVTEPKNSEHTIFEDKKKSPKAS